MFYSGILTEPSRKEVEMREAASLRQQRRMKQAVQFIHKDSADLLPLDGLKKLGTSKDTQPHNILQRRLMETNLSKLRNNRSTWTPKNDISAQTNKLNQTKPDNPKKKEEEDLILVCCQVSVFLHTRKWTMSTALEKCIIFQLTVLSHTTDIIAVLQNKGSSRLKNTAVTLGDPNCAGKDMKAVIDTSCQYNLLSSACLDRLGLKEHIKTYKTEGEKISLPRNMKVIGQIEHLAVTVGTIHVDCSAVVTEENEKNFSLGLQTLKSLKCVINMEKHHLVLGKTEREEIPFVDNNISTNGENSSEE